MQYQPDMIVWLVTLESFAQNGPPGPPLVQENLEEERQLYARYDLPFDEDVPERSLFERSILGQRRALADWLRLQLYGVMWGITGIDQVYPDDYDAPTADFGFSLAWDRFAGPQRLTEQALHFEILNAGDQIAEPVPLLLVNEPIFISDGENSDLRYNLWYPRWAYDAYRDALHNAAADHGWTLVDLWDFVDPSAFTDSPVHINAPAAQDVADYLSSEIIRLTGGN